MGEFWWVISSEVDLVFFPKGVVQDGQRNGVRVRNYLVSARGRIWQLSEFVSEEGGSACTDDVVLYGTREIRIFWWGVSKRTRPCAKTPNWSLTSRFCCSKIPTKSELTPKRNNPIPDLLLRLEIRYRAPSVINRIVEEALSSSSAERTCFRARLILSKSLFRTRYNIGKSVWMEFNSESCCKLQLKQPQSPFRLCFLQQ